MSTGSTNQTQYAQNPKLEAQTAARQADEQKQAAETLANAKREEAEKAEKERQEAERAEAEARAAAAQAQTEAENAKDSDDEGYLKALNEQDDLTLIPADAIKTNHTVKQHSKKVYNADANGKGGVVIAKRVNA